MAKLPPKPLNPVHEFFPVGADGQSPMNYGPKQVKESDKPEEIANKYSLGGESLLNKNGTDYYSENPIVDDPDRPGEKIRKKDLEARQKSQRVEVGKGSSNELDEVVLTPATKKDFGKKAFSSLKNSLTPSLVGEERHRPGSALKQANKVKLNLQKAYVEGRNKKK